MSSEKIANLKESLGGKVKLPKFMKSKKIILLLVVIIAAVVGFNHFGGGSKSDVEITYSEAEVQEGVVINTISSSGTLTPADSYTVTNMVEGDILADYFEEGDTVEADQVLYDFDTDDISSTIEKAEISYAASLRSYESRMEDYYDLTLEAEITGVIYSLDVKVGDSVSVNQVIGSIKANDYLEMELYFLSDEAQNLSVGESAEIMLDGTFEKVTGTITEISGLDEVYSGNRIVREVTIKVANTGGLTDTISGSATIGSYTSVSNAYFTYEDEEDIVAGVSGDVVSINVSKGDSVTAGQLILTIESDDVDDDIQSAYESMRTAELSYETTLNSLDDYTVTSPISGTVIDKNYKSGESLSDKGYTLCVIYDMSHLEVILNIDELDILDIEVGTVATMTCDSVEGVTYEGVVTKVSQVGATSYGVTSYPITIELYEFDGLLAGMNVAVEIVTEQSDEGALKVPATVLNRDGSIWITEDSPSAVNAVESTDVPEGYVAVMVETGISDGSYLEVISGLQLGDTVVSQTIVVNADESGFSMMPEGESGMSSSMSGPESFGMSSSGMSSSGPGAR